MTWQRLVEYISLHWLALVIPVAIFCVTMLAGWIIRRVLFSRLARWTAASKWKLDDVVVESLRGPFLLWVLILAITLATRFSDLPRGATMWTGRILAGLWIISATLVFARLAAKLIRTYGDRLEGALPVGTLIERLVSILIGMIGLLILLNAFGISVTPILTALGVGGLAVALALQDTLTNFFAGFYVSMARQVRVGDFVKLESGEDGFVTDIGWRSTTLRALPNNLIVIPNNKLAQSIVTNFYLPEKRMSVLIPVGVSYDCDPQHVENVLLDVASSAAASGKIAGLLKEPAPFVRFIPGFGDSSLDFTLICQVEAYTDQYLAQHELRKQIFTRFRQEGIEIPFPIRTLDIKRRKPASGPNNGHSQAASREREEVHAGAR
ncbi:MAG: mechanosensitive ion channel family protein [Bryobacteraceae bacterium]